MYLIDGEISLRAMDMEDVDTLYQWENDTSLWNVSDTVSPFSRKAIEMFVNSDDREQMRLMLDCGRDTVGCVDIFGISSVNHNASVGILVYDKSRRGKGIAKRALHLMEDFAFSSLEIVSLKAEVSVNNLSALALFRGSGYREAGMLQSWKRASFGKFDDIVIFQKVLAR